MHGGSVSRTEAGFAECRRHPAKPAAVSAAGTGGEWEECSHIVERSGQYGCREDNEPTVTEKQHDG